jgi:hypothetical protein
MHWSAPDRQKGANVQPSQREANAAAALLAVFPRSDSFRRFAANSENARGLASLVAYAHASGVIEATEAHALEAYVCEHERAEQVCRPADQMTFEALLEQKAVLLELHLSMRGLTDRINALLADCHLELPKVSNSMLTRLKKEKADTSHKQNVLRALAFWLGHDRAHLGPQWNYETLLHLCRGGRQQADHKEGVRIGFALYSRGDVIDHEIVGWLKRELKTYIEHAIGRFTYGRWGKVRAHDITTLYVDFPKEEPVSNPAAYRQCLRSAISLAHQLAIRWPLSKSYSRNRFLAIGIAAGAFANLDNYLLPALSAKLPGDPVIRLTDYARQCVLINDIRALLSPRPAEITLFNNETLTIWWVAEFWSTLYFDFIPDLLEDEMLHDTPSAMAGFSGLLWPATARPEADGPEAPEAPEAPANAVGTFLRFPHNSLLGLEVAKTLYYRRRFWDAIEILRIILSLDPTHLNARTLRMVLLRTLAVEAPSYDICEGLFLQAHQEAAFIEHNCAFQAEDFYCEHAVLCLAQAMLTLRHLRNTNDAIEAQADIDGLKRKIKSGLAAAERLFANGMAVSPTGIRANYLLNTVKVIQHILKSDETLFCDSRRPLDAAASLVRKPIHDLHWQLGYLRETPPPSRPFERLENLFKSYSAIHDDSIALQAYRPTTYYCTAVTWWDLFPVRTAATARRSLQLLQGAADLARQMERQKVGIYSFTRTYGEMLPVETFLDHIARAQLMVRDQAGAHLSRRRDGDVIEPDPQGPMGLLMTVNF